MSLGQQKRDRIVAAELQEVLFLDQPEPCPYLSGKVARLPLRQPLSPLSGPELDTRLAGGDRRCGTLLYRTRCSGCRDCEPIRIRVDQFRPSATQRRVYRNGERSIVTSIGSPVADASRVALYNKHRHLRGLDDASAKITLRGYQDFLIESCCETLEICYRVDDEIAAVAIADRGEQALSAVYCFFDPRYSKQSLGVYSVLKQVELAASWSLEFVYLGLYVADSSHMNYKAAFRPHERLIDGRWQEFGGR